MAFRFGAYLLFSAMSISSWANPIELRGELIRKGFTYQLLTKGDVVWPLIPISDDLEKDLRELQSGDLLEVTLERLDSESEFILTEIHFVKVCRLIGLWIADDFTIVDIADFESLNVIPQAGSLILRTAEEYSYALTPEEGPGWGIFLAQPGRVFSGRVFFDGSSLHLRVWEKSAVIFDFHLTPLYRASHRDQCT